MAKKEKDILVQWPFTHWVVVSGAVIIAVVVLAVAFAINPDGALTISAISVLPWIFLLLLVSGVALFFLREKKDGILLLVCAAGVFILWMITLLIAWLIP